MNYDGRIDMANGAGGSVSPGADVLADAFVASADEAVHVRRRSYLWAAGVAAALLVIWFLLHRSQTPAFDGDAASQAPSVTVIVPGRTAMTGTINATGTLAARHEMPVGSVGDGGEVREVLVNAGQWVRAGQLLAVVDRSVQAPQLADSQANIAVAQADERLAEANLQRALKLVSSGFISKANIDQLTATRDAAAARVRVAAAQRDEQAARLRRLDIVAPADGLVLERDVEPGAVVGPGTGVLFRIAENGEMELRAKLSESDLAKLAVGEEAQVTPVGAAQTYIGHIWQLSPEIDPQTRQGEARIALAYAPGIRPGGFAGAEIRSGNVVAPELPESALLADAQGNYVYVVGAGNKAERRPIRVGLVTDRGVAVAQGLAGTERVVLRAGAFLSAGETVNPKLVPAAQAATAP